MYLLKNASAFQLKRPCVSNKTHLRLNLNARAFWEALFFLLKTKNNDSYFSSVLPGSSLSEYCVGNTPNSSLKHLVK